MAKYWCVNFMGEDCLNHGINESLWLMGYQYDKRKHSPQWKATCKANWTRLQGIQVGDQLVAYVPRKEVPVTLHGPGYALFATGRVRRPCRPQTKGDMRDSIESYLSDAKLYKSGYVYFPPSVVYENFTDDYKDLPVRIDVDAWGNYVPDGTLFEMDLSRGDTVRAAFKIEKKTFDRIVEKLAAKPGQTSRPK